MTGNNESEDQVALARTGKPAPGGPVDLRIPDLPPEVRRLVGWIIGTRLFPDPVSARRWLGMLSVMPRPWRTLTASELRAKALVRFTEHLTGTDEQIRQQRDDVRRALESLLDNPDDDPILTTGCGTVTAAQATKMRNWVEGNDEAALERRAEELRALFEANESYRQREAILRSVKWKLLPCFGGSPYGDRPRDWFVGKDVKVGFASSSGTVEHVWVAVEAVKDRRLVGCSSATRS